MPLRLANRDSDLVGRRRNESASCNYIGGVVGDPGARVVAETVGNETGDGPPGRFDLQRTFDDNPGRTRGRHRGAVDGFSGICSLDGMGGGEVSELRDRECSAGAVHDSSGLAARLIQRELERGPVTVQFVIENTTSGETAVNNVVAEIRGSERPDEWILIGAHLDSWDFGTGAQDNGTGAISVLEVGRALMSLGKAPRRSVRLALWGGEEQGLLGSYAYTRTHKSELDKCVAVLNTDNGAGHPKGWKVEGREDLKKAMQPWSDGLLKDLNGGDLSLDVTYDTDHGPFVLQGIPALDLAVDMAHYMEIHHKSSDTLDKVDGLDFKGGEAIVAVTAPPIPQNGGALAPPIYYVTVGGNPRKRKLEDLLEHVGVWKP